MAYFKLSSPVSVHDYPYDFHSHLTGILPVRGKDEPSLVRWLSGSDGDAGEVALFQQALVYMLAANPFDYLTRRADRTSYERGECAAENIYIACVLIAQRMRPYESVADLPVTDPRLYRAAQESVRAAMLSPGEDRTWMVALARYFNGKIYSSNKFTPFDDAYKMRSVLTDQVNDAEKKPDGVKFGKKYGDFIVDTLKYLKGKGIKHIQIPAGAGDIDILDANVAKFNDDENTQYRVLVHTPSAYMSASSLASDLANILKKLTDDKLKCTIGIDLLGVENRVANYDALFDFLRKQKGVLSAALKNKHSNSIVVHIHNGEGASSAADHRSMIGYYLAYGDPAPDGDFYKALASYIGRCAQSATERRATESAGTRGAPGYGVGIFSRLFDELFLSASLTHRGCQLRRFDINGERSRELAAYNAKRSVMALSEMFDSPVEKGGNQTWYALLAGDGSPYTFRLGHDYYYRNFVAAKYPVVAFDTNLGSNAITGAAALFKSAESYRINKGFRHLDGYIDTDVLAAVSASITYMSSDSLSQDQISYYVDLSKKPGEMKDVLADVQVAGAIKGFLKTALGPLGNFVADYHYVNFSKLVTSVVGASTEPSVRYQALARVNSIFLNWRSYLLGADGQGVEHSDIQDEFVRMVILIAYNLLPVGQTVLASDTVLTLQRVILSMADAYWLQTIGSLAGDRAWGKRNIEALEGYQAPSSVVSLRRGKQDPGQAA